MSGNPKNVEKFEQTCRHRSDTTNECGECNQHTGYVWWCSQKPMVMAEAVSSTPQRLAILKARVTWWRLRDMLQAMSTVSAVFFLWFCLRKVQYPELRKEMSSDFAVFKSMGAVIKQMAAGYDLMWVVEDSDPLVVGRRLESDDTRRKIIVTRGAKQMVVRNSKFSKYLRISLYSPFTNHLINHLIKWNWAHPISAGFRTEFDPRAGLHLGGPQRRGNSQAVEASSTTYLCAKGLQGARHPMGWGEKTIWKLRLLPRWTSIFSWLRLLNDD